MKYLNENSVNVPDKASGYFYRLKLGNSRTLTHTFVRNPYDKDLGFNLHDTANAGVIGGSQLKFLHKEDAIVNIIT